MLLALPFDMVELPDTLDPLVELTPLLASAPVLLELGDGVLVLGEVLVEP